jgi:hypothetical protein
MEDMRLKLEHLESATQKLDVIWELSGQDRLQILNFWWHWWNNRNKLREGELPVSAEELLRRSVSQTEEYLELFGKCKRSKEINRAKWMPPVEDLLKFNCDTAYNPRENYVIWGVVVREHQGKLVAASAWKMERIRGAFAEEFHALEQAIDVALNIGAIRVVFEITSEVLAIAMNRCGQDYSHQAASIFFFENS